jgi:hypothetical protein
VHDAAALTAMSSAANRGAVARIRLAMVGADARRDRDDGDHHRPATGERYQRQFGNGRADVEVSPLFPGASATICNGHLGEQQPYEIVADARAQQAVRFWDPALASLPKDHHAHCEMDSHSTQAGRAHLAQLTLNIR